MRAVVVYESMYGNTHQIADAIAAGLGDTCTVTVVPVDRADAAVLQGVDLVVVGGPTHGHGMSRAATRTAAIDTADKPGSVLVADEDAAGPGVRDWFDEVGPLHAHAAAFDTRVDGPTAFTGRASKGIARRLRDLGADVIAEPESFLVTRETHLLPHETEHARAWGARLAATVPSGAAP